MPDRVFKWLRPENRKPFYVTVSLVVFCGVAILALSLDSVDPNLPPDVQLQHRQVTDNRIKVIGFGGAFLTGLYLIIRSEQQTNYQHKTSHDIRDNANALTLNAQHAAMTAEEAAAKARAAVENAEEAVRVLHEVKKEIEPLVRATNGNLKERIAQVFEEAKKAFATTPPGDHPFPGTMRELEQIMDNRCASIAMNAARLAVKENMDQLRAQGLLPPATPNVQP